MTRVDVKGGRDGTALSEDGHLDLMLALPTVLGGSGRGTNPEQLCAAGFGACLTSSLAFAATGIGLRPETVSVAATVTLTVDDAGAFGIRADLAAAFPGQGKARGRRVQGPQGAGAAGCRGRWVHPDVRSQRFGAYLQDDPAGCALICGAGRPTSLP